jgi:hypothetical protein
MTLSDVYILKEKHIKSKIIPSKVILSPEEYGDLCHQVGDKVDYLFGMKIFLNSKTKLRVE